MFLASLQQASGRLLPQQVTFAWHMFRQSDSGDFNLLNRPARRKIWHNSSACNKVNCFTAYLSCPGDAYRVQLTQSNVVESLLLSLPDAIGNLCPICLMRTGVARGLKKNSQTSVVRLAGITLGTGWLSTREPRHGSPTADNSR